MIRIQVLAENRTKNYIGVAKSSLRNIYSENILSQKYVGNVVAIAAFYDYLSSGRCTTIKEHGGIYDTFEHDSRLQKIIEGLDALFWQNRMILSEIRELQNSVSESNRLLSNFQCDVEQTLNGMSNSIDRIETNNAQTAIHSRNIDANVTYMRWADKY